MSSVQFTKSEINLKHFETKLSLSMTMHANMHENSIDNNIIYIYIIIINTFKDTFPTKTQLGPYQLHCKLNCKQNY